MRPSEVRLVPPLPLVGTLGRTERECAAAIIVRTCVVHGDTWQPVTPSMLGPVMRADLDAGIEPLASMNRNPFARPDFRDLVKAGYATGDLDMRDAPLTLTQAAVDVICAKHGSPREGA